MEFGSVLWMRALGPSQTTALARAASADFRRRGRRNFDICFTPFLKLSIFFFVKRVL